MSAGIPTQTVPKSVPVYHDLLGVLPFLGYGLVRLVENYIDFSSRPLILMYIYLAYYGLLLAGLFAGALARFPRWAYSYLFWALIMGWWLSNVRMNGSVILGGSLGMFPLGMLLLGMMIRRSPQPLTALFKGLWDESTLFTLGIYSFFAWTLMIYDENHHPYLWAFIIISALVSAAGACLYFRLAYPLRRVLVLVAGLLALFAVDKLNSSTWDARAYYNLPEGDSSVNPLGVLMWLLIFGLMVLPGFLSRKQKKVISSG